MAIPSPAVERVALGDHVVTFKHVVLALPIVLGMLAGSILFFVHQSQSEVSAVRQELRWVNSKLDRITDFLLTREPGRLSRDVP